MQSFKQYLESVDPENYERIVSDESMSTKRWNKMNEESSYGGWDVLASSPEATENYINWVSKPRF